MRENREQDGDMGMKYEIKPLEWKLLDTAHITNTVFGRYVVSKHPDNHWRAISPEGFITLPHKTASAAMAAAKAQYQQRLMPALMGAG